MKKAIIIFLVLGALGYLYFSDFTSSEVVKSPDTTGEVVTTTNPDPSNATFIFNDGKVTLSQGRAEKASSESTLLNEEVLLSDLIAYGDINGDSKKDAAVILSRSGGVSGFFIYVAPFISESGSYKGGEAVYIGDRIIPTNISIAGGVVEVEYLDRSEEEPLAAEPTFKKSKTFILVDGKFVEN